MMNRYFFRVEYDGTGYCGWQIQPNGRSLQQEIEAAFATVTRQACAVVGAGRTDAGVHARRQGAHIELDGTIDLRSVQKGVNAILPVDIAIDEFKVVAPDFHARFSAVQRRYKYSIGTRKLPLARNRIWRMSYPVDWELINTNCAQIIGTHDFSSFCASGSQVAHCICTVSTAAITVADDLRIFEISANRFVYSMVRSLIGTLVDIGRGERTLSMGDIIVGKERSLAGQTAPAAGLVLDDVLYPGNI